MADLVRMEHPSSSGKEGVEPVEVPRSSFESLWKRKGWTLVKADKAPTKAADKS